jgi:hypothetical protein
MQLAALLVTGGLLLVGPTPPAAEAGTCVAPPTRPDGGRAVTGLAEETGVPQGVVETRIRWVRWNKKVLYGDGAVLDGQVVTDDGAVADATVDLYARDATSAEWNLIQSATTDPETGVFSFVCLEPAVTTDYRAVYEGALYFQGSQADRRIGVLRRVPDSMKQVDAERFRFRGAVRPAYANRPVLLQQKTCSSCRWRTVERTRSTESSRWRFMIDARTFTGRRYVRAVVPGDASYVRSASRRTWRIGS